MNPAKIALAVQNGLSVVCATCEHYWFAKDKQAPWCGKDCGGPVRGLAFPWYKGPIANMAAQCFVCGDTTSHLAKHRSRFLGVCEHHRDLVSAWCEERSIPFDRVVREPIKKRSLGQAIHEVELYYAAKEGRDTSR